jgi:hypothetical protein
VERADQVGRDAQLDTALIHLLGCGVGAVLVATVGLPPVAALPWLAASVVIHVGYYVTLVGAYRHGDLGFAYPLMRGSAPLLVALLSGSSSASTCRPRPGSASPASAPASSRSA